MNGILQKLIIESLYHPQVLQTPRPKPTAGPPPDHHHHHDPNLHDLSYYYTMMRTTPPPPPPTPTPPTHTTTRISTSSTVMALQYVWSSLLSSAVTYYSSSSTDNNTNTSTTRIPDSGSRTSDDNYYCCCASSSLILQPPWTTGDASAECCSVDDVEAGPTIASSLSSTAAVGGETTQEFAIAEAAHHMHVDLVLSFVSLILWMTMLAMICSTITLGYRLQRERDFSRHNGRRTTARRRIKSRMHHHDERLKYVKSRLKIVTASQSQLAPLLETTKDTTNRTTATGCSSCYCCCCCCICLESFHPNDMVCQSSNCSCRHVFHWGGDNRRCCMPKWLLYHDHCPVCRRDYLGGGIDEDEDDNHRSAVDEQDAILPYVEPLPFTSPATMSEELRYDDDGDDIQEEEYEYDDDDEDDDSIEEDLQERRGNEDWDALLSLLDDLPTWLILVGAL